MKGSRGHPFMGPVKKLGMDVGCTGVGRPAGVVRRLADQGVTQPSVTFHFPLSSQCSGSGEMQGWR